tara:strand:+ start:9348 stop:11048 length:1701 start_codon:yes stop_codon:yes gene_type:complete
MLKFRKLSKTTTTILFVIILIFFSTLHAKNVEKYNKADNISDYFSGILLLNQSQYIESYEYLRKLNGLEESHENYSSKYLYSLVNSGNFNQAFYYSKKLERERKARFESELVIGIYHMKHSNLDLSRKYFSKISQRKLGSILDDYLIETLYNWSTFKEVREEEAFDRLKQSDQRFENLKKIQLVFLNCFFDSQKTQLSFNELLSDKDTDFSRYNYFYAKYLKSIGSHKKAQEVITSALKKHPRNLLLNQSKIDLEKFNKKSDFSCKKINNIVAELLYITANALSSQSMYSLSNFYLNLSKYLNEDFQSFDTLLAENFYKIGDYKKSRELYKKLVKFGSAFKWYSNKQIARILIQEEKKNEAIELMKKNYGELKTKSVYETFDYAEFLKNNEEFEDSIKYYSNILKIINQNHPLYPEITDGRGVAYERVGEWSKAEKDLQSSLKALPDQAYVMNYLAYSWIEKGIKIEKSLKMLEKANKLKSNDPYIIDSLGWALFKLERYKESKGYLQLAVKLMPSDPIVNDHYGDVLWKTGEKIQARYYWNYVLGLKKAEKDLKKRVKKKLIDGI